MKYICYGTLTTKLLLITPCLWLSSRLILTSFVWTEPSVLTIRDRIWWKWLGEVSEARDAWLAGTSQSAALLTWLPWGSKPTPVQLSHGKERSRVEELRVGSDKGLGRMQSHQWLCRGMFGGKPFPVARWIWLLRRDLKAAVLRCWTLENGNY